MIRYEPSRTLAPQLITVTSLGYAYCPTCEPQGKIECLEEPGDFAADDKCDGCGANLRSLPDREITGMAWIEHVPCKIF